MVRFVIYADKEEDIRELVPLLREGTRARSEWALIQLFIGTNDFPRFLSFVKHNPYLVMVLAAYGHDGYEKALKVRDNNPAARMLWFSDIQNGEYSYRIHVTSFGLLPPLQESVELALDACRIFPADLIRES